MLLKGATAHKNSRFSTVENLVEKAGLVSLALIETFDITLSADLQRDISMKHPIAALFKALLDLNELVQSDQSNRNVLAQQGLEALKNFNNGKQ